MLEYIEVSTKYKKLFPPERQGDGWKICGYFDVYDADGYCWDTYGILIFIPLNFPYELPSLFETTGKIEKHEDWHNKNGLCCLSTNAIMFKELGSPISLLKWLDRFVHDFLANHVIKLRDKSYVNGEYSHGAKGIIEGYMDIFSLSTEEAVRSRLNLVSGTSRLMRNDLCFCDSGKKYKRCFELNPRSHCMGIPFSVIEADRLEVTEYLNKNRITF